MLINFPSCQKQTGKTPEVRSRPESVHSCGNTVLPFFTLQRSSSVKAPAPSFLAPFSDRQLSYVSTCLLRSHGCSRSASSSEGQGPSCSPPGPQVRLFMRARCRLAPGGEASCQLLGLRTLCAAPTSREQEVPWWPGFYEQGTRSQESFWAEAPTAALN